MEVVMKKILVLLALSTMVASSAFAVTTIVGSKHDLSTSGTGTKATNYSEVCVFCHTPHNAYKPVGQEYTPLWNRAWTQASVTKVYNSTTFSQKAAATISAVQNTDLSLCLTCHDGTVFGDQLNNPSNLAGGNPVFSSSNFPTTAMLDDDFSNDHPIGFSYSAAQGVAGSELIANPTINSKTVADTVQCSSCHDVHDSTYNFINTTMSGSALCLACHQK